MSIEIRPLAERDLSEADRIFRVAFGTFIGLPDPASFASGVDYVASRWRAAPQAALGAYRGDQLIGSNFVTDWGSFGFFGPLSVRPDHWDRGIARQLLAATLALFEQWGTRQQGLFTFPQSTKHVALYQKFGFWPQALTCVMAKPVLPATPHGAFSRFGAGDAAARAVCLDGCLALTDAVFPGLDVRREIRAVDEYRLGETVCIDDDAGVAAFAICHLGADTEAGPQTLYVKFAAVRPGAAAAARFERLLAACETLAHQRGLTTIVAGVNTERRDAYRHLLSHGFRGALQGVAMQRPDAPGFNRPDCYVIDDWR